MKNIRNIVKALQNIMRKDPGCSGDGQRIEQLGWMLFLKILDDRERALENTEVPYYSTIQEEFRWSSWSAKVHSGPNDEDLPRFVSTKLYPALRNIPPNPSNPLIEVVRRVFENTNNYMRSGEFLEEVVKKINEIEFRSSSDRHLFGDIYESILAGLQNAGNYGEFYTPRAITDLLVELVDPQYGEVVIDPACGTGGFLVSTIEHIKSNSNKNMPYHDLGSFIKGEEFKPLPYMLCVTNLLLHDIGVPQIEYHDSLGNYNNESNSDLADVVVANPPFGASVSERVSNKFPIDLQTRESADLFLLLIIAKLKFNGRAAIVLPDGSLTGAGVKARIREHLLNECNLHTIVRLPNSVFQPYASVATNLLFFDKGKSTKEIWYWEHQFPEGVKAYSKKKPIQKEEFNSLKEWWHHRKENDHAWKVPMKTIKESGYNIDIKNPHIPEQDHQLSTFELVRQLAKSCKKSQELIAELEEELGK